MSSVTARPRYPFGLDDHFNGFNFVNNRTGEKILEYHPNEKQWKAHNCNCDEVFYGGAVGGGKSHFIHTHVGAHCLSYGPAANTVVFRRIYDDLDQHNIPEFRELFDNGSFGTWRAGDRVFYWNNGAKTAFRHLEKKDDVQNHKSRQYTLIAFDELTDFLEDQYIFLWTRLRSAKRKDVITQVISGSNPRGVGHKWVNERFVAGRKPGTVYRYVLPKFPEHPFTRVFVPATITDNEVLMENDPGYLARMRMNLSDDMYEALAQGDWTMFEGQAFPEFDPKKHVIERFPIPSHWKVIRSLDWGYGAPFSAAWWAQNPDTDRMFRVAEWYGAEKGSRGGRKGLRLAPREFREGFLDREAALIEAGWIPKPWYGQADPEIFKETTEGRRVIDQINVGTPLFRRAQNNRALGKAMMHQALRIDPNIGRPKMAVFDNCKEFLRIFPSLALDDKTGEKVDSREDHAYDEARYAVVNLMTSSQSRITEEEITQQHRSRLGVAV
jgi:hypothetical protein